MSPAAAEGGSDPLSFEIVIRYGSSRIDRIDLTRLASIRPAPEVTMLFRRMRHNVPQSVVVRVDAGEPIVAIELVFGADGATEVAVDALRYYPAAEERHE